MPPIHALEALSQDRENQAHSRHSEPLKSPFEVGLGACNEHADLTSLRPLAYGLIVSALAMFAGIAYALGWLP